MTRECSSCGSPAPATVRYCENCGTDLDEPPPATQTAAGSGHGWELVIRSDREYFERVEAEGVQFPSVEVCWTHPLTGDRITVGRGGNGAGPVLDLSGPPADAGISHVHAELSLRADGRWTMVDCGSTNGTFLNDQDVSIPPGEPIVLADGDRIHLGAWTCITLRRVTPGL